MTSVVHSRAPESPTRGPSVDPIVEIDIENDKRPESKDGGFNFEQATAEKSIKRVPANITTNEHNVGPFKLVLPFFLLIVLPMAVWFLVSKKFTNKKVENVIDIDPEGNITVLKRTAKEEDDHSDDDLPKAS